MPEHFRYVSLKCQYLICAMCNLKPATIYVNVHVIVLYWLVTGMPDLLCMDACKYLNTACRVGMIPDCMSCWDDSRMLMNDELTCHG